jgi:hypothetical protein
VDGAELEASIGGGGSGDVAYDDRGYRAECASMVSFVLFFFAMKASGAVRCRQAD